MYQQAITHRPFLVWWVLNLKVKALVAFSAFGMVKSAGEEFTIEDSGKRLDLEKLGWILPLEYEVSEDQEPKKTKKVTKKAK